MRAAVLALLVVGCKIELDHHLYTDAGAASCATGASAACLDAVNHQELTWLQANIFNGQCTFSGCHNGAGTLAGPIDLRDGQAYSHLVGATSMLDSTRKLVVAGNVNQSYLMVMLGKITPAEADPPAGPIKASVGLMPMDNAGELLCCQKLDAVDRWITAGAMNN